MGSKLKSEVWLDKAIKSFKRGDLESAEVRLMISKHLAPSAAADSMLKIVLERKKYQRPKVRLPNIRESQFESLECIRIAKQAIEKEHFNKAKRFLYLAQNCGPNFYNENLMYMLKHELVKDFHTRRNAKMTSTQILFENARADFEAGNYDKAERLLLISINTVFPTQEFQCLLEQVHKAMELERRITKSKRSDTILKVLNILTCRMLECFGFMRHDDENEDTSSHNLSDISDPGSFRDSQNSLEQEHASRFEPGNGEFSDSDSEESCNEEELELFKEYLIYCKERNQKAVERVLNGKDDYEILGIPRDASWSQIQTAFRRLALALHPDKNNAPKANQAFVVINDARKRLLQNVVQNKKKRLRRRRSPSNQ